MMRLEAMWLAVEPLDMRCGMDKVLAQVVHVFGSAQVHHAYLFTNRRANRLKVLMHDGIGIWLAARRLHRGQFQWMRDGASAQCMLNSEQVQALVMGLPWQRLGADGAISYL